MIRRVFSPPVFEKDEDNFRARFINNFAWAVIGLLGFAIIPYLPRTATDITAYVLSALIGVMFLSLYFLHKRRITASGLVIVIFGWIGIGFQAYNASGVKDAVILAYIVVALAASIIVNWRIGGAVIIMSIAAIWFLAILEINGIITPRLPKSVDYARDLSVIFGAISALIYLTTTSLQEATTRAIKSEESLQVSNRNLQELNLNLEDRISSRTSELELANQRNEKRARQFEAIAQVARATTLNQNLETLLPALSQLISNQFGFYHVGVFLLDEERSFAELRAANSEGGRRMLNRGHKLAVGQSGIVGYVSATGRARIALDVGDDAAYFNNPDLPTTRSEMALPLYAADEVIGVLDVQSTEANAFQEEDIEVLSTLADQVAIAIQNAHTYDSLQDLLNRAQSASGSVIREAWQVLNQENEGVIGYQAVEDKVLPITKPLSAEHVQKAMNLMDTVRNDGEKAALAIPIRLRGQMIGVMDIQVPREHNWDPDEIDIVEAIAERLSLSLEASLLLKSTQRRAEIERITAEISTRIGATTQFDSIIRTAAEELSRALGGSEVLVQIQPDAWLNHED